MARLVDGENHALAEMYQRHGSRVIAVAEAVLGDRTAAEDVCHEVFVQTGLHPQPVDDERGALRTHLVVMAHACALDRQRAGPVPPTSEAVDGQAVASSVTAGIWAAVGTFPAQEAAAVRIAYFGGSTYREVACLLDVAEATVKSGIRSGLRRLREALVVQGVITTA